MELANRPPDNRRERAAQVRLSAPRLLLSPWGDGRVDGRFSQTCRLTAENDEGPLARAHGLV